MLMPPLRVLITNHALAERSGTELYVRDLALDLLARGHTPVVFTTRVGELGRKLREATVPVVDDLHKVAAVPHVIHGQHHAETMTALLHFTDAPAVFFCHGWLPDAETPPRHPRILRYVAVDDTCCDRLVCESGVPPERTRVILNPVDLARFRPRGPLPPKPLRALVFSNSLPEYVAVVREACARAGVKLDVAGAEMGGRIEEPEKVLGRYDLVFAKARCALEALAVGAAVVLCDAAGSGPLVTTGEVARLRRLNFGVRALRNELRADTLAHEIALYDAADAAEVSRRVRAQADKEETVDDILSLYREILEEFKDAPRDPQAESRAAADYLRRLITDTRRDRETFENSATGRLRALLLGLPLVGSLTKSAAKRFRD
jgi:hypothetical protein